MALYKPSNFYPNMDEVDLEKEEGQEFECKINANGSEVNAYKLEILSEDGIPLYESYNNLNEPKKNGDFLNAKMLMYETNVDLEDVYKPIALNFTATDLGTGVTIRYKLISQYVSIDTPIRIICNIPKDVKENKINSIYISSTSKNVSIWDDFTFDENLQIYSLNKTYSVDNPNICFSINFVNEQITIKDDMYNIYNQLDFTVFRVSEQTQLICPNIQFQAIEQKNFDELKDYCPYNLYNINNYNLLYYKVQLLNESSEIVGYSILLNFYYDNDTKKATPLLGDIYDINYNIVTDTTFTYNKIRIFLSNDFNYKWNIRLYENKLNQINQTELTNNTFITDGYLVGSVNSNIWYLQDEQYGNMDYLDYDYLNKFIDIIYDYTNPYFYQDERNLGFTLEGSFQSIKSNLILSFTEGTFNNLQDELTIPFTSGVLLKFSDETRLEYETFGFDTVSTVDGFKQKFKMEPILNSIYISPDTWEMKYISNINDDNTITWKELDNLCIKKENNEYIGTWQNGYNYNTFYENELFTHIPSDDDFTNKIAPRLPVNDGGYKNSYMQFDIDLDNNLLLSSQLLFVFTVTTTRAQRIYHHLQKNSNISIIVSCGDYKKEEIYDLENSLYFDKGVFRSPYITCITYALKIELPTNSFGTCHVQLNIANKLRNSTWVSDSHNNHGYIIAMGLTTMDVFNGQVQLANNCVNLLKYKDNINLNYIIDDTIFNEPISFYSPVTNCVQLKNKNQQQKLLKAIQDLTNKNSALTYNISFHDRIKIIEHNINLGNSYNVGQLILKNDLLFRPLNGHIFNIYDCDNKMTKNSVCLNKNITDQFKIGDYIRFPSIDNLTLDETIFSNIPQEKFTDANGDIVLHSIIGFDDDTGEVRFDKDLDVIPCNEDSFEIWEKVIDAADLENAYYTRIYPNKTAKDNVFLKGNMIATKKILNNTNFNLFIQPNINMLSDKFYMPQILFNQNIINLQYNYDSNWLQDKSFDKLNNSQWYVSLIKPLSNLNQLEWYKVYAGFIDSAPENYFYARDRAELTVKAVCEYPFGWSVSQIEPVDLLLNEVTTLIGFNLNFIGNISNINIKRYRYKLFEQESATLVFDTNYLYDDKIECLIKGFVDKTTYDLFLEVETDLGLIYKQNYIFKIDNYNSNSKLHKRPLPEEYLPINNKFNSHIEIYDNYPNNMSNMFSTYVYKKDNVSYLWEYVGTISPSKTNKKVLSDYNIRNNMKYTYMFVREISASTIGLNIYLLEQEIKTCAIGYTLTDIYKIKDGFYEPGESWNLAYNLESNDITSNLGVAQHETQGRYGMVTYGKKNYDSGTVTSLLGEIRNDKYTEEENSNNMLKLLRWNEFITNGNLKILKDLKGNKWIVNTIDNPTRNFNNKTSPILTTVSFSWIEVMDSNNISIVSVE